MLYSIMEGLLFLGMMAAVFCAGWFFAVVGLISDTAYESLNAETSIGRVFLRLSRMMRAHAQTALKRFKY